MLHGNLFDPVSASKEQRWNEPVQFTVKVELIERLAPVSFVPAVVIHQLETENAIDRNIEQFRRQGLVERIITHLLPAGHAIRTLGKLFKEASDFLRVVLQVRIDAENDCATGGPETGRQGSGFTEIAAKTQQRYARIVLGQVAYHLVPAISAAIVDEDHLERLAQFLADLAQFPM